MIKFDYKGEQAVTLSQGYVGEAVNVEVLDEFGYVDYDFKIPRKDFIKMFGCKEEQAVTLFQSYAGEAVNVEVLDEFGYVDCDFKIPQEDFIKMLDEYQKNNNII